MKFRTLALALALVALPAAAQPPSISFEPQRPTTLQPVHVTVTLLVSPTIDPQLVFSHVEGKKIVFRHKALDGPGLLPPSVSWTAETFAGPLRKGFYTVVVDGENTLPFQRTFEVTEPSPDLLLQQSEDSEFIVTVDFEAPQSSNLRGTGYGVPLTRESGYFWFFSPENIELTVKVLDGRAVNGRWWVFLASMTDLPFTVTVLQCPAVPTEVSPCNLKQYTNPKGVNRNILDVNAFTNL